MLAAWFNKMPQRILEQRVEKSEELFKHDAEQEVLRLEREELKRIEDERKAAEKAAREAEKERIALLNA
jgi:hypothetical protein